MPHGKRRRSGAPLEPGAGSPAAVPGRTLLAWGLLVSACAFLVFVPSLSNGFLQWDDGSYVAHNESIARIDAAFWRWLATSVVVGHWHPLTMLSLAVDRFLWGTRAWGFHLTNSVLHALNAALFLVLGVRLLERHHAGSTLPRPDPVPAALAAAVVFAVHPLRVESVAWISERKDLLCGLFSLLCVLCHVARASATDRRGRLYAASLGFCALALLSKPMAVTLPVVLLLLDYHPLRRLSEGRTVIVEKLPFLALSAGASLAALWSERASHAVMALGELSVAERLLVAARAPVFYTWKLLLPLKLAPLYPLPKTPSALTLEYGGSVLLVAGLSALCWSWRHRRPGLACAWCYYLVTLLPVAGIVQVGKQSAADRYTYLPQLGPLLLLGSGLGSWYTGSRGVRRAGLALAGAAVAAALGWATVRQTGFWKDSLTLWTREIALYPDKVGFVHSNLGQALMEAGRDREAAEQFEKSVALGAGTSEVFCNLGTLHERMGRPDLALTDYLRGSSLAPGDAALAFNLGTVYDMLSRPAEAVEAYERAVRLQPSHQQARNNLGAAYAAQGRWDDAIRQYRLALGVGPAQAGMHVNLAVALAGKGLREEASRELQEALRLEPGSPLASTARKQLRLDRGPGFSAPR